jgi:competence protein ComEA
VLPIPLSVPQRRLAAVALVCLAAAFFFLHHRQGPTAGAAPVRVAPIQPAASASGAGSTATHDALVVDVVGAVVRPGLYRLPHGARVADAVRHAGGLTRKADRAAVNLAAPLVDGEQVRVAAKGAVVTGASSGGASATPAPVSLSTATAEQLDALPGVGPVTAQKIVTYREQHGPFTSVEALDAIPGIGPARIADLQGLVVP